MVQGFFYPSPFLQPANPFLNYLFLFSLSFSLIFPWISANGPGFLLPVSFLAAGQSLSQLSFSIFFIFFSDISLDFCECSRVSFTRLLSCSRPIPFSTIFFYFLYLFL